MAMDFPSSPSVGQSYTSGGISYTWDGQAWMAGSAANPVMFPGWRNKLINGDMGVAQRGTTFSSPANETFTLDRWVVQYNGTGAFTLSQADLGLTDNQARSGLRWNQSSAVGGGATYRQFTQRIEGVETLAGKTVTVSFTALVSPSVSITPVLRQFFGTGGSPSTDVFTFGSAIPLTGSGTRYSQTLTLPSVVSKTRGSNGNDYLGLVLALPITGTYDLWLWDVQIEEGAFATPFERRPLGTETELCRRYYQAGTHNMGGYGLASGFIVHTRPLAPMLRAAPTVSQTITGPVNVTTSAIDTIRPDSLRFYLQATATAYCSQIFDYKADAEL